MAGLAPWVFVVVLLRVSCDAAVSNAHEETCLDSKTNNQLVQARRSLDLIADKEEDLAATKIVRRNKCPWLINEGKGCHQDDTKPLCEDGNFSWSCKADGHGERLLCPCEWPRMCSHKTCRGGEYCCEPTCINHGGMRPCEGEEEPEPTNEPDPEEEPTPTPEPTPEPNNLLGDGIIRIKGAPTYCLNVQYGKYVNGASIIAWSCSPHHDNMDFEWRASDRTIRPKHAPTYCFDVDANANYAALTPLKLWECSGASNQQFTFDSDSGSIYPAAQETMAFNVEKGISGDLNDRAIILWEKTSPLPENMVFEVSTSGVPLPPPPPTLMTAFFDAPSGVATTSNWGSAMRELMGFCQNKGYKTGVPTGHRANIDGKEVRGIWCLKGEGVNWFDAASSFGVEHDWGKAFRDIHNKCEGGMTPQGYGGGIPNGNEASNLRGCYCFKRGPFFKWYDTPFSFSVNGNNDWAGALTQVGGWCQNKGFDWGFPNGHEGHNVRGANCFKKG